MEALRSSLGALDARVSALSSSAAPVTARATVWAPSTPAPAWPSRFPERNLATLTGAGALVSGLSPASAAMRAAALHGRTMPAIPSRPAVAAAAAAAGAHMALARGGAAAGGGSLRASAGTAAWLIRAVTRLQSLARGRRARARAAALSRARKAEDRTKAIAAAHADAADHEARVAAFCARFDFSASSRAAESELSASAAARNAVRTMGGGLYSFETVAATVGAFTSAVSVAADPTRVAAWYGSTVVDQLSRLPEGGGGDDKGHESKAVSSASAPAGKADATAWRGSHRASYLERDIVLKLACSAAEAEPVALERIKRAARITDEAKRSRALLDTDTLRAVLHAGSAVQPTTPTLLSAISRAICMPRGSGTGSKPPSAARSSSALAKKMVAAEGALAGRAAEHGPHVARAGVGFDDTACFSSAEFAYDGDQVSLDGHGGDARDACIDRVLDAIVDEFGVEADSAASMPVHARRTSAHATHTEADVLGARAIASRAAQAHSTTVEALSRHAAAHARVLDAHGAPPPSSIGAATPLGVSLEVATWSAPPTYAEVFGAQHSLAAIDTRAAARFDPLVSPPPLDSRDDALNNSDGLNASPLPDHLSALGEGDDVGESASVVAERIVLQDEAAIRWRTKERLRTLGVHA